MFSILRPFIFNLDPEVAHDLAIKSLKLNPLPSKMFEVEDEKILNIELLGKNFPNPIGLAAGFDKDGRISELLYYLCSFIESQMQIRHFFIFSDLGPQNRVQIVCHIQKNFCLSVY